MPRPIRVRFGLLTALILILSLYCRAMVAQGAGYWHTSGAQILDANNTAVRIAGINWYGFETSDMVAHGLDKQDYKAILQAIKDQGYNTVRIPFSNQMIENPTVPSQVHYSSATGPINIDLQGLNSLEILDAVIAQAGRIGLRVILDNHRSEAGNGAQASGLWYTDAYPEVTWIKDWVALTQRYLGNTTVIGMDLRNEPHNANSGGACWSCGTAANDWHLAAVKAGNAILDANPKLLIFVEGTDAIGSDYAFWGAQLAGVSSAPVSLSVPQQLVYSAHDYGPVESAQPWFNGASYAQLVSYWNTHWGYIAAQGIAPVWVGEFGTPNGDTDAKDAAAGSQGQWFSSLIQYLAANSSVNWTYWALNGEDRYGLLPSDYSSTPQNALKQQELQSIQFALSAPAAQQTPKLTLSGSAASVVAAQNASDAGSTAAPTQVTYTAVLSNDTSAALSQTSVLISLPTAAAVVSASSSNGSCTTGSGTYTCTFPTVAAGDSAKVTVTAVYLATALDFSSATTIAEPVSASSQLGSGSPVTAVATTSVTQGIAQSTKGSLQTTVSPGAAFTYGTTGVVNVALTPTPASSIATSAFTATLDGKTPITVAAVSANQWQIQLGALAGGQHTITVQLAASSGYAADTSSVQVTVNPLIPTLQVTGLGSLTYGQLVKATVGLTGVSGLASTTGTISASVDSGTPVQVAMTNNQAVLSLGTGSATGTHAVSIAYTGDGNYGAVTQKGTLQITPASLTAIAAPAARMFGAANPTFTGTLTGVVNNDGITATYSSAAGSLTSPGIYATGADAITPVLQDPLSRLQNYNVTLTPATLTITPPASISWSNPAAIVYGTPLSTVQLNATSTPALTLTYSPPLGSVLNVGTQKLTVSGVSDTITVPVTTAVQIVVQQAPTSTIISAPTVITSPYTVTATVTSAQGGVVTGPVNFFDDGVLIGAGALDAKGTASFVIPTLSAGPHSFTATFPGDPNNLLSSSAAAVVAGTTGDFALALMPSSLQLKVGSSGSTTLDIAPKGGITGTVKLTCAGLPTGSTCTFAHATLTLDGSANHQTTDVTVTLPQLTASVMQEPSSIRRAWLLFPCALILAWPLAARRRRPLERLLLLTLLCGASLALNGCQATQTVEGTNTSGSYIGSYNATITAASGTVTQSTTIQVNVLQ